MSARLKVEILLIFCVLLPGFAAAQTEEGDQIQQQLEAYPEVEEQADFTDLTYWLSYYNKHPLNINFATEEELSRLGILNPMQIEQLTRHIEKYGKLVSIYELQAVTSIDALTAKALHPYIKIDPVWTEKPKSFADLLKKADHELSLRYISTIEQERGYQVEDSLRRFQGEPFSLMTRYQYSYDDRLSFGLTADKDAGEPFLFPKAKGFDFYSAHAFYRGEKLLKAVALGDYNIQMGQGLVVWSSYAVGLTGDAGSAARSARGVLPSRSANENQYMRGGAVTLKAGRFDITSFASSKRFDASLSTDTFMEEELISAEVLTGYHRNSAEIEKRRNAQLRSTGAEILYRKNGLKMGLAGVFGQYSGELTTRDKAYELYEFQGRNFFNTSFSYSYLFRNIYFFGEEAINRQGAPALLNGAIVSLHPKLDLVAIHRHYDVAYTAPLGNAFGANTRNSNETGFYTGANFKLNSRWRLSASANMFSYPWLKYRVDAPSRGHIFLLQADHRASGKISGYMRYRNKEAALNYRLEGEQINHPEYYNQHNLRVHLQYEPAKELRLQTRAEYSLYSFAEDENETGFLIYQNADYEFSKFPLKLSGRYTLFDIDSYDARIYVYEQDLPYTFSIPSFQDEGTRWYLLARYRIGYHLKAYLKLSRTSVYNKETISSGLTEIDKPHRTEIRGQLVWGF